AGLRLSPRHGVADPHEKKCGERRVGGNSAAPTGVYVRHFGATDADVEWRVAIEFHVFLFRRLTNQAPRLERTARARRLRAVGMSERLGNTPMTLTSRLRREDPMAPETRQHLAESPDDFSERT